MRLLLLLNGPKDRYVSGADDARAKVWGAHCSPGTELTVGYLPNAREDGQLTKIYPFMLGEAHALSDLYPSRCLQAQQEGFDAVMVHCFADPGLAHTRQVVDIPVIGPGEVTLRTAALMGRKIGLTVPSGESAATHETQVEDLGLGAQVVGLESVRLKVQAFAEQDPREMTEAMIDAAERLVQRGAEVICPSGLAYIPIRVSAREVAERVGVPVLDPSFLAVRTAEMIVAAAGRSARRPVAA